MITNTAQPTWQSRPGPVSALFEPAWLC